MKGTFIPGLVPPGTCHLTCPGPGVRQQALKGRSLLVYTPERSELLRPGHGWCSPAASHAALLGQQLTHVTPVPGVSGL